MTNNLQRTKDYRRKYDVGRIDWLAAEFKRDQRLANKAIRMFSLKIDLCDDSNCTKQIFSCSKCEKHLTASDCKQLSFKVAMQNGFKRFSSLVMDGKVIGSLRELSVYNGDVQVLVGTKGLNSKLVDNRATRAALKYFMKALRRLVRAVEYGRGAQVVQDITMCGRRLYIRLGSMLSLKGVNKGNYGSLMKLSRWYFNDGSCLCKGKSWNDKFNHLGCEKQRKKQACRNGCAVSRSAISMLFGVGGYGTGG